MVLRSTLVRSLERSNYRATKPRRSVVNGKSAAFHVNDLKRKPNTSYSSSSLASNAAAPSPTTKKYESDMVVVLDLDECLIHSQFMQGSGARYAHQVRQTREWQQKEETQVETFEISLPGGKSAKVHERPFLHDFLSSVSAKYETHLFTASMEVYATPIIKRLDPHGTIFTDCWYRDSCVMDPSLGAYVKDLEKLHWGGNQMKRTVLVDNNPLSFLANPENGILVSSFFDDPNDKTLLAVKDLLHDLNEEEDVRPILDARFGLRESFEKLSKTGSFAGRQFQIDEQQEAAAAEEEEGDEFKTADAAAGLST